MPFDRQINPYCTKCILCAEAKHICLKGSGELGEHKPLMVFLDHPYSVDDIRGRPFVSDAAELLKWMLARMSIKPTQYHLDYIVKCYPGKDGLPKKKGERTKLILECSEYRFASMQSIKPQAIVTFGQLGLEAFLGHSDLKNYTGAHWPAIEPEVLRFVDHVWTDYSMAYPLQAPGEAHGLFGTLWFAAQEAGLTPKINSAIKPFQFPDK